MNWIGLGQQKWTRVQLCCDLTKLSREFKVKSSEDKQAQE